MASPAAAQPLHGLYVAHHAWLVGWLRWRVGCPHDAADMAQDTFTRLLGALRRGTLPELDTLRQPRAFLATAATRVMIDEVRRREIERACLDALAQTSELEESVPSPERVMEAVQLLTALAALLDGLSVRARQAFLMYRLDGMAQPDIAAALGVSTSRVKQYVAQAMVHCYAVQHGLAGG